MCGIYGWSFHTAPAREDFIVFAAVLGTLNDDRGGDSWGWATPEGEIFKGIGGISDDRTLRDQTQYTKIIAHTRFRTEGPISIEAAHPYKFGTIVGAHNGCIYNSSDLNKKYKRNFPVDSMHIFKHISEGRYNLEEFEGYGSIHFFDLTSPNHTFFARMRSGEFSIVHIKNHGLAWSSSRNHLKIALQCAGLKGEITEPREGRLYCIEDYRLIRTPITISPSEGKKVKFVTKDISTSTFEKSLNGSVWKSTTRGGVTSYTTSAPEPDILTEIEDIKKFSNANELKEEDVDPDIGPCVLCGNQAELCPRCDGCVHCCTNSDACVEMHALMESEKDTAFGTCDGCGALMSGICNRCRLCRDCCDCVDRRPTLHELFHS